jgi:hypothetical protein
MCKVDIVIPAGGTGEYFKQTLDSVLSQTFGDFRVVVVENGIGHRAYRDAVQSFDDRRVSVVGYDQRVDIVASTFRCMQLVRSPWGIVLHDDDIWSPDFLESSLICASGSSDVVGVLSPWDLCINRPNGELQKDAPRQEFWTKFACLPLSSKNLILGTSSSMVHMSALLFRNSTGIGLHPASLWNFDARFGFAIARFGALVINPNTYVFIRSHTMSQTSLTSNPAGMGGIENLEQARDGLIAQVRTFGAIDNVCVEKAFQVIAEPVFWRGLVLACFSWPLRHDLCQLGKQLLRNKTVVGAIRQTGWLPSLLSKSPEFVWCLISFALQLKYYAYERRFLAVRSIATQSARLPT